MKRLNERSRMVTEGVARAPNRSMYYAMGYEEKDFVKPMVGVANGHSTITPCNSGLQKLADAYKDKLVIVGFPANNFGAQEPGTDGEIQEFCKARFGVTFPLASKVSVNGDDTAPIYKWLTNKAQNGVLDATISWNFNKFLLDENGKMIAYYPSSVTPDSEEITKHLK